MRRSEDVQDVFLASYVCSIYVLCLCGSKKWGEMSNFVSMLKLNLKNTLPTKKKKSITVSETLSWVDTSTLSWRKFLLYRNQTIDLLCKSVETGVYKIGASVMKELIEKLSISRDLFFSETFSEKLNVWVISF